MTTVFEENLVIRNVEFYNDDLDKYDDDLIKILEQKSVWELRLIIKHWNKEKNIFNLTKIQLQEIIIDEGLL